MNVITIAGNLVRDAEIRTTNQGEPVANFTIADGQVNKDPIFWNCAIFDTPKNKRVHALQTYLTQGKPVTITGSILQNNYVDRKGIERTGFNIRVNEIALQGGKKEGSEKPQDRPTKAEFNDDVPF